LEGRLVEPRVREGGLIVLARRCGQEAREQLGADHHPARIDAALGADPLEFGVEGVGSLLGSVGEAPGHGGQSDAGAVVLAAPLPIRLLAGHGSQSVRGCNDRRASDDRLRTLEMGAELRDVEPEVGFEPTAFRLRARCSASNWTELEGNYLLTLGAASIWSGPDRSSWIDWMIIGMIKAHSILRRTRTTLTARSVGRGMTLGARPRTARRCHKERGMLRRVGDRRRPVEAGDLP
jgi:hypothetical protein